jgi:predicted RNA binding protein YcfA (HicA-like mRNA interferase family)
MKHSDGRITVIPVHAQEEISTGLMMKIIKDTGLSREECMKLLKEA